MSPLFLGCVLDQILFKFAGNDNIHESLDEFEIWLDLTTGFDLTTGLMILRFLVYYLCDPF